MKPATLKNALVFVVFAGLLAGPSILKPKNSSSDPGKDYGFRFIEVSSKSGISFQHHSPVLDDKISHIMPQIASVGAAVSVCDFNNDGWNDLYFTNSDFGKANALYRNNQDGTFTDVALEIGIGQVNNMAHGVSMGSIWADIDNDGDEDLFIYKWGRPELYVNDEGKSFENVTESSGLPKWLNANTAVWLDFDNDGLIDLFIGGYYDESINLWNLNSTRFMPESFEYANNGGKNYLFRNTGNGRFNDVTEDLGFTSTKWTLAAVSADINGDLFPELIIANDYSIDEFYLNAAGKRFVEIGKEVGIGFSPKSGMNVSLGDVENDGEVGLYVSNITESGVLLQGNNFWKLQRTKKGIIYKNMAGRMNIESGGWSYGAQFGDLNNDGFQDLYVANGFISGEPETSYWYDYSKVSSGNNAIISDAENWPPMEGKSQSGYQQNVIWVNLGNGRFEKASAVVGDPVTLDSRAVATVDLWNRGVLDVVVANQNNTPFIYMNEVSGSNHWIDLDLVGTSSNKSAIGARVDVSWNGQNQVQYVTGGVGFSAQNQHRLHFGIGGDQVIDEIKIIWPSGKIQTLQNPGIDRIHRVVEES